MFGICHVSVVLLFVRFALCQSCDCKLVEVLSSRVDMLESLLGSGTRNIASSSIMSSESVIIERLGELETTTENIKTQLKEITTERQKDARLNSALIKAWKIHKLGFSGLTEDIKQSSSDNNKSFHNLLTDFDKSVRLFEFKFEELLNKSNNEATKQQQAVEVQFDTIRSDMNTTFNDYKSRMDTDIMVFINKTEKQLHAIQTEVITDECASNPCMNGATCLDGVRKYSCICMDGFNGTNCQTEIDECASNPCMNGATCVDAIDGYSCRCQAGYMYAGTTCQIEIDECNSNPCKNGATCVDGLDNYSCGCVAGYSGLNCQIDIDDCSSRPCMNGATCVDGLNKYSCRCLAGYSGLNCQIDLLGAKSGHWSGFYMYSGGQYPFTMDLEFRGSSLTGIGVEGIGNFFINGTVSQAGEVVFVKQYIGANRVDYNGNLSENGREMSGRWNFGGHQDSFTMKYEQH